MNPQDEILLSEAEFKALLEYSCSLPTGTAVGKRWRCDDSKWKRPGPEPDWWMGEYAEHPDPERVRIVWRRIVHKCRCEGCDQPTRSGKPGGFCSLHAFFTLGRI